MADLYDVVAVRIDNGARRLMSDRPLTERNADALMRLAVWRRGVEVEFYIAEPHPASIAAATQENEE